MRIFWADLHNHNDVGYGKGSLERSYALAENTLDVYAFTPHGFWPDPPESDARMATYHLEQFDRVRRLFPRVVEAANAHYRPGRFVTFAAYEWHSTTWGDYVALFPGAEGELCQARDLGELKRFARAAGALLIPHHVGYREGWRGLRWEELDPALSPVVEVFSEHGNSLERDALHPMILHSMGGVCATQTAMEQLRRGRRFGFTAGTDDHYGYPACYEEGLTGIAAEELTREAVFDALRRRHTLAATGDRIEIEASCGSAAAGDVAEAGAPRRFEIAVRPAGPLEYVQVLRNGEPAAMWPGPTPPPSSRRGEFVTRLEWGWGRLGNPEGMAWHIELTVEEGELLRVTPCFCGGEPSIERMNRVWITPPCRARIESFTSRQNTRPTHGAVLRLRGSPATRLRVRAKATGEGEGGEAVFAASLAVLAQDDVWEMPLERFSSPRICLARAWDAEGISFRGQWEDAACTRAAAYVVKAQQRNGQCAWSSPIFFDGKEAGP